MVLVVVNKKREMLFKKAKEFVNLDSVLGVRANGLLVKTNEKTFEGISGIFFWKTGDVTKKELLLSGSKSLKAVSIMDGKMEIYFS